jgi:hypothetical protein
MLPKLVEGRYSRINEERVTCRLVNIGKMEGE